MNRPSRSTVGLRNLARVAVAAALLSLSGCRNDAPNPPKPENLTVSMTEYSFGHRSNVRPGRVVVRVSNRGNFGHEMTFLHLPPDFQGTLDAQLRSPIRRALPTIMVLPAVAPGERSVFALDLVPGRYAMFCGLRDPDGVQHFLKGMSSELTVR